MGTEIPDTGNAGAMRRAAYTERPCTYERDDKQGMRLFLQGKTQQAVWQDFPHRGKGYGIRREQAAGTGQGGIPHDSEPLQPPHIRGGGTCRTVRHGLFADAAQVQNILRYGAIGVAAPGADKAHRGGYGIPGGTAAEGSSRAQRLRLGKQFCGLLPEADRNESVRAESHRT